MAKTLGEKRNNPGCIRGKKGFITYSTLEAGYEGLNSLLYRRYDHMTLKEFFNVYAPVSDGNNHSVYIKHISSYMKKAGFDVNAKTVLDFSDPNFRGAFSCAISIKECGSVLGGEEFAMQCAKKYDPAQDTRPMYSNTEKRRKKRASSKKATPIKKEASGDKEGKTTATQSKSQTQSEEKASNLSAYLASIGSSLTRDNFENKLSIKDDSRSK